jgi:tRNA-splicing ligase RtcB
MDTAPVLRHVSECVWEVPRSGGMRVPGRIYADERLMEHIRREKAIDQVINVAHLPGIVRRSLAMPDIHWGYGFPIGGVAATDPASGGVVSPGGVGYDINCGVRLGRADPAAVGKRAVERGLDQLGTLGSGNHFMEIDAVEEVYEPETASAFGLSQGTIALLVHSGSRGFGYQICDDSLDVMQGAVEKYGISLPDRQLACAPVESAEGRSYLAAMACAANYAWANRQVMMVLAERALARVFGKSEDALGLRLVYDVCHNIAKLERHAVDGEERLLCVHRKGATRAFPSGHPDVPGVYRSAGQPVLVPGDMGTASFVCVGTEAALAETFGSTCHGAGRVMSRAKAKKSARGRDIERELAEKGIVVMATGRATLAEEMPAAYKNVADVVDVMQRAGIARRVARMRPLGVVKG